MNRKRGTVLMTGGMLLLLAAFLLTCYNLWDDARANRSSQVVLEQLLSQKAETTSVPDEIENPENILPDYMLNPNMEMPIVKVNGQEYIGVLEIPALSVELPVISEWSYPKLRIAPCRYAGSAYRNNLVLAAHNYNHHFGGLKNLQPGNEVIFTDMDNNIFHYEVQEIEVLEKNSVDEMISEDWDLTLFTCTIGGRTRVTVRCKLEKNN